MLLDSEPTRVLFETPVIVGSQQVYAAGLRPFPDSSIKQTLVLEVNHAHDQRPAGADPLDIRDSADWLDCVLHLDPQVLAPLVAQQCASHMHACQDWEWKTASGGQLHFRSVWDELSAADSHYGWGVTVQGDQPLRLVRHRRLAATDRQLIVTVSCGVPTASPARIEVLAVGRLLAAFDVPVLDRDHVDLIPQKIPLDNLEVPTDGSVEFEIRQYPGPAETPVQWHGIEFASSG